MDSASSGRPLWDALAATVASDCTDDDLHELLIQLGDGSAATAAHNLELGEEGEFWEAVTSEEYGTMLLAPKLVSPDMCVGPTSFTAWANQEPIEAEKIRAVYALFVAAGE